MYINGTNCNYDILNLLKTNGEFDEYFIKNGIDKEYYGAISNSEIFPNVNNQYVSLSKETIIYKEESWASVLTGNDFNYLLQTPPNDSIYYFIDKLLEQLGNYYHTYEYNNIVNLVNTNINFYIQNPSKLAYLSKLFIDEFNTELSKYSIKPNILLNANNEIVSSKTSIFTYPTQKEYISLPSFVNITYLSQDLMKNLLKVFNLTEVSELAIKMKNLNLHRYDPIEIIRLVFNEINNIEVDKIQANKEAIIWLYNYSKTTSIDFTNNKFDNISLLAKNMSFQPINKLYFGVEYNENLCELLYPNRDDKFIIDYKEYGVDDNNKEDFKTFLKQLGIESSPRLDKQEIYFVPTNYKELCNDYSLTALSFKTSIFPIIESESIEEILNKSNSLELIKLLSKT